MIEIKNGILYLDDDGDLLQTLDSIDGSMQLRGGALLLIHGGNIPLVSGVVCKLKNMYGAIGVHDPLSPLVRFVIIHSVSPNYSLGQIITF